MNKEIRTYEMYDFFSDRERIIKYHIETDEDKKNANPDYVETVFLVSPVEYSIDVFMDDYGQCYYVKYIDKNGKEREWSCGTYNFDYLDDVFAIALHENR